MKQSLHLFSLPAIGVDPDRVQRFAQPGQIFRFRIKKFRIAVLLSEMDYGLRNALIYPGTHSFRPSDPFRTRWNLLKIAQRSCICFIIHATKHHALFFSIVRCQCVFEVLHLWYLDGYRSANIENQFHESRNSKNERHSVFLDQVEQGIRL